MNSSSVVMRITLGKPINGVPYPFLGIIGLTSLSISDTYAASAGSRSDATFSVALNQSPKDAYFNVVLPGTAVNERDPIQQGSFAHL